MVRRVVIEPIPVAGTHDAPGGEAEEHDKGQDPAPDDGLAQPGHDPDEDAALVPGNNDLPVVPKNLEQAHQDAVCNEGAEDRGSLYGGGGPPTHL